MHEWKTFYTNNYEKNSHQCLKSLIDNKQLDDYSVYIGVLNDVLPTIEFVRNNRINGYFQSLDNKLSKNTFGMFQFRNDDQYFVFLFKDDMSELFKESSLYDACNWTKITLDEGLNRFYPDLFENNNELIYKKYVFK